MALTTLFVKVQNTVTDNRLAAPGNHVNAREINGLPLLLVGQVGVCFTECLFLIALICNCAHF